MSNTNRSLWPGLILLLLGIIFLLNNLEISSVGHLIGTYWPLILILVGIGILIKSQRPSMLASRTPGQEGESHASQGPSSAAHLTGTSSETGADTVSESSVFGNISLKPVSRNFKGGALTTVFGNIDLNLTSAELAAGEQHLDLHSVFGGVHITLPRDIGLLVRGNCLFGEITVLNQKKGGIASDITFRSENYDSAVKKLNINASQVFGDIKIW